MNRIFSTARWFELEKNISRQRDAICFEQPSIATNVRHGVLLLLHVLLWFQSE